MIRYFFSALLCCLLPTSLVAQAPPDFGFGGFGGNEAPGELTVSADAVAAGPGLLDLKITVELPSDSYIYSSTTPFGIKTAVELTSDSVTKVGDLKADRAPKVVVDKSIDATMEKFFTKVTWTQRIKATGGDITAGSVISGTLTGQYCNDKTHLCIPIEPPEVFEVVVPQDYVAPAVAAVPAVTRLKLVPEMQLSGDMRQPPIAFEVSMNPAQPVVGEDVTVTVQAAIEYPYHVYSNTMSPDALGGTPTEISVVKSSGLQEISRGFEADSKPELKTNDVTDDVLEIHHGMVSWSKTFLVADEPVSLEGLITFQVCNETSCLPPAKLPFRLVSGPGSGGDMLAGGPMTSGSETPTDSAEFGAESGNAELIPFIISAIGFGFVALLTPCVFPMIPVTISYFLKQGSDRPGGTLKLAIIYCLGIVGAFTVLGLMGAAIFGPASLNTLANNKWLNLFFAGVFTLFGLMLLGMFEFRVPSWLLTWSSKKQEAGGVIGVLFMALTFTLVSFTCTFAFVGQLLVWASQGDYFMPIIGMIAFSTAFASPFFFLALFPSMLQKLPKSGGWMNTVKVTMGLLELAIVAKFLSVADTGFSPTGLPRFLDYHLVMGAWIAVSAVTGLYLLGLFRMPHDSPSDSIGPLRCMFSLGFVGLAAYIAVGLFSPNAPNGMLWQQIVAFAPPQIQTANGEDGYFIEHDGLKYSLDFDSAVATASMGDKPMFLDFTGVNCINCRLMEKGVLSKEDIHSVLKDLVRVQLYVDQIPGVNREVDDYQRLLDRNHALQKDWFGDVAIPAYAITTPDGSKILSTFKGLDSTGIEFKKFLAAGLSRWEAIAATNTASSPTAYKNVSYSTH